jgi:hypothetical protein
MQVVCSDDGGVARQSGRKLRHTHGHRAHLVHRGQVSVDPKARMIVSRIAGLLDEQVRAFGERLLDGRCSYLFVDAKVESFVTAAAGHASAS